MKICYLSSSELPSRQANGVHVVNMCQALSTLGHEVVLLGRGASRISTREEEATIFDYYGVPGGFAIDLLRFRKKGAWGKIKYAVAMSFRCRRLRPDLVVSRNLPGSLVAVLLGLRVVHEFHAPPQNPIERFLSRLLVGSENLDGVVFITHTLKTDVEESLRLRKIKTIVLPDGANPRPQKKRGPRKNVMERLKIGYAGSFYSGRGIEIILELAEINPHHLFLLIGDHTNHGPNSSPRNRSFPENVEMSGFIPPKKVGFRLEECDILLAPYQEGTVDAGRRDTTRWMSPLKIFEYMAVGRPMIASDLRALREILKDSMNCLLVKSDDVQAWNTAIKILEKSRTLRERIASRALEDFEKNYSWDRRARRMTEWITNSR